MKPYDSGEARRVLEAPRVLRELGVVDRLVAKDLGDVPAPPYRDFERPAGGVRNEREIAEHARALAARAREALARRELLVLLGGDCSILLGTLLAARPCGLAFIDGHADFATPELSRTGGVAGMDLAFAVGRGEGLLARLAPEPLVAERHVAAIGRKDLGDEPHYGAQSIRRSAVLDLPWEAIATRGVAEVAHVALERVADVGEGFVIHLDADVLHPSIMPAVDSPEAGGMSADDLAQLVSLLAAHPRALALEVTVYDPHLDPDRKCGQLLVDILARALSR